MANPSGIINGTKSVVEVDTGSGYVAIVGEASHSITFNNELIDITNKSSGEVRSLLASEGQQSFDMTVDTLFSDDAAIAFLRTSYFSKAQVPVRRTLGSLTLTGTVMVQSIADTAPSNDKATSSYTLTSTDSFAES